MTFPSEKNVHKTFKVAQNRDISPIDDLLKEQQDCLKENPLYINDEKKESKI